MLLIILYSVLIILFLGVACIFFFFFTLRKPIYTIEEYEIDTANMMHNMKKCNSGCPICNNITIVYKD